MKTLTIKLPDAIDLSQKKTVSALSAQLYEIGNLSLGQVAKLAGYSKRAFIEILANYSVSIFNFPA